MDEGSENPLLHAGCLNSKPLNNRFLICRLCLPPIDGDLVDLANVATHPPAACAAV